MTFDKWFNYEEVWVKGSLEFGVSSSCFLFFYEVFSTFLEVDWF